MPNLRPFRDYDEKDIINLFAFSGSLPCTKGTLVKIVGSGFLATQEPIDMIGSAGDFSVSNVVSQRYGLNYKVGTTTTGERPLGVTLFDTRDTDENGFKLYFEPRKAAEMEAVVSGQAVPVLTRGIIHYDGITGSVTAGQTLYAGPAGVIEANVTAAGGSGAVEIGQALGAKDEDGYVLVRLDL